MRSSRARIPGRSSRSRDSPMDDDARRPRGASVVGAREPDLVVVVGREFSSDHATASECPSGNRAIVGQIERSGPCRSPGRPAATCRPVGRPGDHDPLGIPVGRPLGVGDIERPVGCANGGGLAVFRLASSFTWMFGMNGSSRPGQPIARRRERATGSQRSVGPNASDGRRTPPGRERNIRRTRIRRRGAGRRPAGRRDLHRVPFPRTVGSNATEL